MRLVREVALTDEKFASDMELMRRSAAVTMWILAGAALLTGLVAGVLGQGWGWLVLAVGVVLLLLAIFLSKPVKNRA